MRQSGVFYLSAYTYGEYSSWLKSKHCIMQHACILSKCNSFGIALQWFLTTQCSDILYTKVQLYSFPVQWLRFLTRYGHSAPCLCMRTRKATTVRTSHYLHTREIHLDLHLAHEVRARVCCIGKLQKRTSVIVFVQNFHLNVHYLALTRKITTTFSYKLISCDRLIIAHLT